MNINETETFDTTVGIKDKLVKHLISTLADHCDGEVDMLTHAALLYELCRELLDIEDEANFRAQLSDSVSRIITNIDNETG